MHYCNGHECQKLCAIIECVNWNCHATRHFWISQRCSLKFSSQLKKITDKVLLNIRRNSGSITAAKKNMMNTCIGHKGKCRHVVIWEGGNAKWICLSQEIWTDGNSICTFIFWRWTSAAETNQLTQFSSASELGNEMQLKLRLSPFSLIHVHCQHALCFQFHNLHVNSAQRWQYGSAYWDVPNPLLGIVLSVDYQGKKFTDQCAKVCGFCSSPMQWPIWVQNSHSHFLEKDACQMLFWAKVLSVIKHSGQVWGKMFCQKLQDNYSPKLQDNWVILTVMVACDLVGLKVHGLPLSCDILSVVYCSVSHESHVMYLF